MKSEKIIDLKQQLIGLFEKEEVLAFFDFELMVDPGLSVQGLCKISEPKVGASMSNYLSLLFIVDVINDATEAKVDSYINGIFWHEFKKRLNGIDMIVRIPHVNYGTRHLHIKNKNGVRLWATLLRGGRLQVILSEVR